MMKIAAIILFLVFIPATTLTQDRQLPGTPGAPGLMLPSGVVKHGDTVYLQIRDIDYGDVRRTFLGLREWGWKKAVIDLFSYGGSLFQSFAIAAILKEQQLDGKIIEIRAKGIVASAGLIVFLSGSPGYRLIDKYSLIMFHEMWTFKFFAIETPSDKENEAAIFRKIQNHINTYITDHSRISAEELNRLIRQRELWCNADEAIKYGFADRIIGSADQKEESPKPKNT